MPTLMSYEPRNPHLANGQPGNHEFQKRFENEHWWIEVWTVEWEGGGDCYERSGMVTEASMEIPEHRNAFVELMTEAINYSWEL